MNGRGKVQSLHKDSVSFFGLLVPSRKSRACARRPDPPTPGGSRFSYGLSKIRVQRALFLASFWVFIEGLGLTLPCGRNFQKAEKTPFAAPVR